MLKLEKSLKNCILPEAKVICVTGGMASGKNYVSSLLEKDGWKSVDADKLVHKAIEQASTQIYDTFKSYEKSAGVSLKNPDGTINRRSLGVIVFSDPKLLQIQEQIVYPIITKMIQEFASQNQKTIINATVLYKTPELLDMCSQILFVKANLFKRILRARKRDNLPFKEIIKRFYSQKRLLSRYKETKKPVLIIKN